MKYLALLLLLPLVACSDNGSSSGGPRIEASFYPLQWVAERIAGDTYEVGNLTKPGQEPHDTELSLRKTAELSDATVVFYEKGLAANVDDAIATAEPEHVVDAAMVGLVDDDPHFWLDPSLLLKAATAFELELAKADPDNADTFEANLDQLRDDLYALDQEMIAGLEGCAITTVVVSHDAFAYFGRHVGLEIVSINGLSPEAQPSPAHIQELQELIKAKGITTVFNEELASAEMADTLADDLDLRTGVLDPIEGLSDETADEDYLSLMRNNLAALQEANQCTS